MKALNAWLAFVLCNAIGLVGLSGCLSSPVPAPLTGRKRIIPYEKLRIGVLEFSSPRNERDHGKVFAAMFVKALRKTNHFLIHEVAGFRGKIEGAGDKYLDMYLSGTIRSAGNEPCAEVRLVNAQNHEIRSAFSPCGLGEVDNTVGAITKLFLKDKNKETDSDSDNGEDSPRKRSGIKLGSVKSVDGNIVVIDKGSKNLIKRGMVASVHAKGEQLGREEAELQKLTKIYAGQTRDFVTHFHNDVVGSIYVISVEPEYSIGVFYEGDYAIPGDEVDFK